MTQNDDCRPLQTSVQKLNRVKKFAHNSTARFTCATKKIDTQGTRTSTHVTRTPVLADSGGGADSLMGGGKPELQCKQHVCGRYLVDWRRRRRRKRRRKRFPSVLSQSGVGDGGGAMTVRSAERALSILPGLRSIAYRTLEQRQGATTPNTLCLAASLSLSLSLAASLSPSPSLALSSHRGW